MLLLVLVMILMASAAYYLLSSATGSTEPAVRVSRASVDEDELALPAPERPVEAPPQRLDRGLGGAFFDNDWEEDEAATEVAVMPPSAPAPPPPAGLSPMMSFGAIEEADEQATEVMDANSNAQLAAAIAAASEDEIPSFGDRGGAYFDDDWDDDEAPTAVMTGDMADRYAEMLADAEDADQPKKGPGRVVAGDDD